MTLAMQHRVVGRRILHCIARRAAATSGLAFASGVAPPVGGPEGIRALALADAADESARTGQIVRI